MAAERTRGTKTQSLSLRLDPKTKFILEFMARIKGQSITTVVERAINATAADVGLGPQRDDEGDEIDQLIWRDFWDPNEGVRTLKLFSNPYYPTTFDEDELRAFTINHWPFFYTMPSHGELKPDFIEILWPNIERYLQIWRENVTTNHLAAGEAMKADLSSAGVEAPDWPPKIPKPFDPADLDDDDLRTGF